MGGRQLPNLALTAPTALPILVSVPALQQAEEAFQSGQYSTALADANQAKQLADQATITQTSPTSAAATSISQIPVSSSAGFIAPATAVAVMVLVLVVISEVMIRIRRGNKERV